MSHFAVKLPVLIAIVYVLKSILGNCFERIIWWCSSLHGFYIMCAQLNDCAIDKRRGTKELPITIKIFE